MPVKLMSFGYKHGIPKGIVCLDCRDLDNPHKVPELKPLTGRDDMVKAFVKLDRKFIALLTDALKLAKVGDLAFGCIGGRHRSVAMAEITAAWLRNQGMEVEIVHRELD